MAGINVTVERMMRSQTLTGIAATYSYAALTVAGPWIFTMLSVAGLSGIGCETACDELPAFRSIIIYNSLFSLVVTSPIAFFAGRFIADRLHQGRTEHTFFVLVASLSVFLAVVLAAATPFYLLAAELSPATRIAAVQNAVLIGVSWLLIPFLAAASVGGAVLAAFGLNAAIVLLIGRSLSAPSSATLLLAFNIGFVVTDVILLAALVRRSGCRIVFDAALLAFPPQKWELPAAGLAYAVGIWIDKIIMWFGAPSGGLVIGGVLRTMPSYDAAVFWAQLSSIPVIAVAFVHVEGRFAQVFRRFYGRLDKPASLRELTAAMEKLRAFVISSIAMLFAALLIVAMMMILLSFVFMEELGLRPAYMSILRISLWAMAFHTSAMFCFVFLLYFDLRRPALLIVLVYAVLNAGLTLAFLPLGQAFYGYGSMTAAATTFVMAFGLLLRELPWLHYHAFITNNTSLQRAS